MNSHTVCLNFANSGHRKALRAKPFTELGCSPIGLFYHSYGEPHLCLCRHARINGEDRACWDRRILERASTPISVSRCELRSIDKRARNVGIEKLRSSVGSLSEVESWGNGTSPLAAKPATPGLASSNGSVCPASFTRCDDRYTTRRGTTSKLLTTKGLLQSGDRDVRPTQIGNRRHSKNRKVQKNSLHILELQELRRR
jgi:hypothetical protein